MEDSYPGKQMSKQIKGKIKVLHFIHSSAVTGPGRIVYGLVDNINKDEFLCDVMCPSEGALANDLRKIGARIISFDPNRFREPLIFLTLSRLIRREGYHILHIHSGQFSAFWKIFGRAAGIPGIIYTEHVEGSDHSWIKGRIKLFLHLLSHPISNWSVDRVIAVSKETRACFIERQGISDAKVVTIYNGVYTRMLKEHRGDRTEMRKKLALPNDACIIGMVARFASDKGHMLLVQAAKKILQIRHDIRFLLIGEGPERISVTNRIAFLGLQDYFVLTGFQNDVYGIMDCIDVAVQPSIKSSESFGLTLVEAMAKHKAVVASDIGCFREIVDDGVNGLLFTSEDSESLKDKILLLSNDGDLRDRLGAAAQKKVEARFDISITAEKTGNLYKELLGSKGYVFGCER